MEQRNYKLYVHIAPNGKKYYGITCQNTEYRWNNGRGYRNNKHLTNAINKYGWDNFQHIVLFDTLTTEEACLLEKCYITLYDTTNPKYGYNNSLGGEHGLHSEQSKKKNREAHLGKYHTEESKRKMSENNARYWKGKSFTEEHRKKLSEVNKGKTLSKETKQKISEATKGRNNPNYGKHMTEEQKLKLSKAHKGKKASEEHKRKISEGNKGKHNKPILMYSLEGIFIRRFNSVTAANEYLGKPKNTSNIITCARGKQKTSYGYIWKYEE